MNILVCIRLSLRSPWLKLAVDAADVLAFCRVCFVVPFKLACPNAGRACFSVYHCGFPACAAWSLLPMDLLLLRSHCMPPGACVSSLHSCHAAVVRRLTPHKPPVTWFLLLVVVIVVVLLPVR